MATLDPETLYRQLGHVVAEMPDLTKPLTPDGHRWLGRAAHLVELASPAISADPHLFSVAAGSLEGATLAMNSHQIAVILHRALARAEANAPTPAQGAFIPVGAEFAALQQIGSVLRRARTDLLIGDPYMDGVVLTDFALSAPPHVTVRLLSDQHSVRKDSLLAAAQRWIAEYGAERPLEIRQTPPRAMHNRIIIVDGKEAWTLTQSIKDFADRAFATILRAEGDMATLEIGGYEQLWAAGTPML